MPVVQSALVLISFFGAFISANATSAQTQTDPNSIEQIFSPWIEGDTLFIKGTIDSHIYDYLSYQDVGLKDVKYIDLNSFGGNAEWALEIAKKIQGLGKITRLSSGNFCASACVFLFSAGQKRLAAQDTWLGIHGARLGAGYTTTFQGLCFAEFDSGPVFIAKLKGCSDFVSHWYDLTKKATDDAFSLMESSGVWATLRQDYYALPDDPNWPLAINVFRKPDWPLTASEALKYNLVTELIP